MLTDLHMHTTASDGEYAPADLMTLAHQKQLTTLAVTDHDTTDGYRPARDAAEPFGITVVPGIELSAETEAEGDVHILGYFINIDDQAFQERLKVFRENRYHRGKMMIAKLNELGIGITFADVERIADGAPITRPHVARALIAGGYASGISEAFDTYLTPGKPAYVERTKLLPEEAIELIHSAGGAAVLAHPGLTRNYADVLTRLIPHAIDGVEVNHPKNPSQVRQVVRQIAVEHNLIMTGGSDFHRPNAEDGSITLGTEPAPDDAVERLSLASQRHNS